ncbi:DUF4012 domain-containing protein [Microbacterium rhizophilus]|uniref:DUF4012 domain-containing protein n=1 Tax=Microbacterium rhizophilus TaxID=3138934 RepID=UPI0031EFC00A
MSHTPDDRTAPRTRRDLSASRRPETSPTAIFDVPADEPDESRPPRRSRKRAVIVTIVLVVVVLLLAAVWLAFRAITVKNELESAQAAVAQLQKGDDVPAALESLGRHGEAAASASGDPVWRVAEFIPFAGPNLQGVRLAAESLDVLANDLAVPAYGALNAESGEPVFARLLPAVQDSTPEIQRLAEAVEGVRESDALIPQVREGVDMVAPVMSGAAETLPLLPELLGANGPRNYLMVSQNNAESVGLGGSAGSQTLLHVDNGRIEIAGQADSQKYSNNNAVDVEVPQSAIDLYSDYLVRYVNTSASRPDFPTMAQILSAWWQRDIAPDQIDGVVAIDPIVLGYMIGATGPVDLATGDTLDSKNAADMLLNGIYMRYGNYRDAPTVDAFFASAAVTIFEKVAAGDFDAMKMASAISRGIEGGNVMFWSAHKELQDKIAPERVSGILPTDNEEQTAVGVYFRDESGSKIDYYMKSAVAVNETCADGRRSFTTKTALTLDIDQAAADALPQYIKSMRLRSAEQFYTAVYVYGPPGTEVESVSVDGRDVTEVRHDIDDLGRPVAWFMAVLKPGESGAVTTTFTGDDGDYGPLEIRSTPMINKTAYDITTEGCAAR